MRIVVDLNRCQAYAQCCFLAPSVFQLHGEEALFYDPASDEAPREQVLCAAAPQLSRLTNGKTPWRRAPHCR
jgi:ferredoxin